jgi:hypothetical protein
MISGLFLEDRTGCITKGLWGKDSDCTGHQRTCHQLEQGNVRLLSSLCIASLSHFYPYKLYRYAEIRRH